MQKKLIALLLLMAATLFMTMSCGIENTLLDVSPLTPSRGNGLEFGAGIIDQAVPTVTLNGPLTPTYEGSAAETVRVVLDFSRAMDPATIVAANFKIYDLKADRTISAVVPAVTYYADINQAHIVFTSVSNGWELVISKSVTSEEGVAISGLADNSYGANIGGTLASETASELRILANTYDGATGKNILLGQSMQYPLYFAVKPSWGYMSTNNGKYMIWVNYGGIAVNSQGVSNNYPQACFSISPTVTFRTTGNFLVVSNVVPATEYTVTFDPTKIKYDYRANKYKDSKSDLVRELTYFDTYNANPGFSDFVLKLKTAAISTNGVRINIATANALDNLLTAWGSGGAFGSDTLVFSFSEAADTATLTSTTIMVYNNDNGNLTLLAAADYSITYGVSTVFSAPQFTVTISTKGISGKNIDGIILTDGITAARASKPLDGDNDGVIDGSNDADNDGYPDDYIKNGNYPQANYIQ